MLRSDVFKPKKMPTDKNYPQRLGDFARNYIKAPELSSDGNSLTGKMM